MFKIFFIMGKGGSGKDTVASDISRILDLPMVPLHQTRKKRPGEGDTRYVVQSTMEEIEKHEAKEARYYQHVDEKCAYATFKEDAVPFQDYLAVGPSEMYRNYKTLFDNFIIVPIILDVSTDNRIKRMDGRNPEEAMRRVMADDKEWLTFPENIPVVDGNNSRKVVVEDVLNIIRPLLTK